MFFLKFGIKADAPQVPNFPCGIIVQFKFILLVPQLFDDQVLNRTWVAQHQETHYQEKIEDPPQNMLRTSLDVFKINNHIINVVQIWFDFIIW